MTPFPVAVHLASLRQPFKQSLHTAARLGASGVEIDARGEVRPREFSHTAVRHLRKTLENLDLRVAAIAFPTRRGYDVPEDLDRRIEATKDAMRLAHDLGTSIVTNHVGRVPEQPEGLAWDMLVQVLTELGAYGQHVGVRLAARTGSEEGSTLAGLIDALPPGSLAVDLDPGRLIINDFSPREAVNVLGPHIASVRAIDGVRDLAQGRGVEVTLGRGSADLPELLGALEPHAYRGFVTVQRHGVDDPVREIGQAISYLNCLD